MRRHLEEDGEALEFLGRIQALLEYLLPQYRQEKKRYLTIDIGCTGGCHRSVFLVDRLRQALEEGGNSVHVRHRDMKRELSMQIEKARKKPIPENA